MMETNLSNGMNDRSYSRFFGFVIVMSAENYAGDDDV